MRYRVVLTENAKWNLQSYYQRAAEAASKTAADWLDRFEEALQTLGQHPERCQLAMENSAVEEEIRQFQFGKRRGCYRVLFTIAGDEVQILHIRRAAMDVASRDDLYG